VQQVAYSWRAFRPNKRGLGMSIGLLDDYGSDSDFCSK
jgi:hypothetical protein